MANYTFECQDCSSQFEAKMSFADRDAGKSATCVSCGSEKTLQVFQALAMVGAKTSGSSGSSEPWAGGGGACMPGGCGCYPSGN